MKKNCTKKDIMQIFNVSLRTVDKWMAKENLPFFKESGIVRFDPEKIKKWAEERERGKK